RQASAHVVWAWFPSTRWLPPWCGRENPATGVLIVKVPAIRAHAAAGDSIASWWWLTKHDLREAGVAGAIHRAQHQHMLAWRQAIQPYHELLALRIDDPIHGFERRP